jgi:hypothetical protein
MFDRDGVHRFAPGWQSCRATATAEGSLATPYRFCVLPLLRVHAMQNRRPGDFFPRRQATVFPPRPSPFTSAPAPGGAGVFRHVTRFG